MKKETNNLVDEFFWAIGTGFLIAGILTLNWTGTWGNIGLGFLFLIVSSYMKGRFR